MAEQKYGMFSDRFNRAVIITRHAAQRMLEREISDDLLLQVIETGQIRHSDVDRLWVVKTVMHHWELMP